MIVFLALGVVSTACIVGLLGWRLFAGKRKPAKEPSLLSARTLSAFAFGLGWAGLLLSNTEIPFPAVLLCAVSVGAATFFAAYFLSCILHILSNRRQQDRITPESSEGNSE